jgi:hypothetical protein
MIELCRSCNICHLDEQAEERVPYYQESEDPKVLLIDDNEGYGSEYDGSYADALYVVGKTPFTYTSTIRCKTGELTEKEETKILAKCSVWTHLLAADRKLIISTQKGLVQLGLGEEHPLGDVFADDRLGIVVVIPPVGSQEFISMRGELQLKVRRAVRGVIV